MPYARKRKNTTTKTSRKPVAKSSRHYTRRPKRQSAGRGTLGPLKTTTLRIRDRPQRQIGAMPFARSMFVRLPFAESFGQTSPATFLAGVTVWRLNSLNSPDTANAALQPMQYDQLTGIYKKYHVYGCKVDLEFSNPTSDGLFVGYAVRSRNLQATTGLDIGHLTELRHAKIQPIMNTGSQIKRFSFYVKLHDLIGVPKMMYNADEFQYAAAFNANPTEFAFLEVITVSSGGIAQGCNVRLRMTYFAKMYNYQTQMQS